MPKILIIDSTKCTGCRLCELVCSVKNTGVSNPSRARIHIVKWEGAGLDLPMVCQQCETAPCLVACPTQAILRDEKLGRVIINYDACIGCKVCITACPFGAMSFDPDKKLVFKCDLCNGEPVCARFCPTDALTYLEANAANLKKKRAATLKFSELTKKLTHSTT